MSRRDLLVALAVTSLATAGLSACGSDDGRGGSGSGSGGGGSDGELGLVSSDATRTAGDPEAVPDVVAALQRFGGGLFGRVGEQPGNLAVSPYSVALALAMTLTGAAGTTADEMSAVLAPEGLETSRLNGGLNALEQALEKLAGPVRRADGSTAEVELAVASALFGEASTTWKESFLEVLAQEYGAGMRTVDFVRAWEQARVLINGWTADQTNDRIPELIPEGVLDTLTRLVLVNALYLKAPWEAPFEKTMTAPGPFHLEDGSTVQVDTMRQVLGQAQVSGGDGWRAVRLPYAGRRLAMTVVLPDEGRLADVEAAVAAQGCGALLAPGQPVGADLRLPRWTFRTAAALKPALQDLGMTTAFEPGSADLSGMTDEEDLHVSAVLHEVFVAVDEDGTEAAAATAVVVGTTTARIAEPFVVDRPFLFVIHDVDQGAPLFLGRVADPRGA